VYFQPVKLSVVEMNVSKPGFVIVAFESPKLVLIKRQVNPIDNRIFLTEKELCIKQISFKDMV
jgi:hypothetical protein